MPEFSGARDPRLKQIVSAILRIADQDFSTALQPSSRRDELDAIIVGINAVSTELSRHYEELDRQVAERTRLLEEAGGKLAVLAYTDVLTGAANRAALIRALGHAIDAARRGEPPPVLVLLDMDGFKQINDCHGHAAGDAVLALTADRLRGVVREADVIARIGGDEFAVLLTTAADAPLEIGRRIAAAFDDEMIIGDVACQVRGSIGIAVASAAQDGDRLLLEADTAMYEAKRSTTVKVRLFEPAMLHQRQQEDAMLADLRSAVGGPDLYPEYQPIVDLVSGRWVGAEALIRWNRPGSGAVPPGAFLPLAERAGLLSCLTDELLATVLDALARWRADGTVDGDFTVHVNVSSPELHALAFPDLIREALRAHDVPASALAVEITEHRLMTGDPLDQYSLNALRAMGVAVHIDDFGTGYSSIGYLNRLSITGAKLDMGLVAGIVEDLDQRALLAAAGALLRTCHLERIVEGVETAAQAEIIAALGFERAQGFFYARPLPEAEFVRAMRAGPGPATTGPWHHAEAE